MQPLVLSSVYDPYDSSKHLYFDKYVETPLQNCGSAARDVSLASANSQLTYESRDSKKIRRDGLRHFLRKVKRRDQRRSEYAICVDGFSGFDAL